LAASGKDLSGTEDETDHVIAAALLVALTGIAHAICQTLDAPDRRQLVSLATRKAEHLLTQRRTKAT